MWSNAQLYCVRLFRSVYWSAFLWGMWVSIRDRRRIMWPGEETCCYWMVEKEREIVEQERAVESIADKISKSWGHMSHNTCVLMHCLTHRATQEWFTWSYAHFWCWAYSNNRWSEDNNLCRQEQKSEKIWHLEKRVMEHRAEEMGVAETLTKTRSELKGLLKRRGTLSLLLNSEQHWIETVGVVSVCVCSNRWLTPSHRSSIMCSHSSIQTRRAHT